MRVETVITILSIVGATTMIDLLRRGRRWTKVQRFLRLKYREPMDVVLNTAPTAGSRPAAEVDNEVLFGNVKCAALVSQIVGSTRSRKSLALHLSECVESDLNGDLVLIGGTTRSRVGRMFLAELNAYAGGDSVEFDEDDETANRIRVGDYAVTFDWSAAADQHDVAVDYALVVMWVNPFSRAKRRGVFCSGFTSFGTCAAMEYVFGPCLEVRREPFRAVAAASRRERARNAFRARVGRAWPAFAMALEIQAVNGRAVNVVERGVMPLSMRWPPRSAGSELVGLTTPNS